MSLPPVFDRLRLPVIGSPLFIISNPDLVIAQCKAGVVGSFPALNARPGPVLEEWLQRITSELAAYDAAHPEAPSAPFAVNQIVHKSNDRLEHDVALCVKYRVPIIITSLGARPEVNQAIHSYGGIVLHDVIDQKFARKAVEKGAALVPSAKKRGGLGTAIDVPLGHKDAAFVRSHFDAIEARVSDAPRADEILVAVAVTDSGRPLPRIGGLQATDIKGEDGLR